VLKAGFRKCHRRQQHRLPLGCELRELLVAASANDKPPNTSPASLFRKMRLTRGCVRELKNAHNSVTVQNRTHVYMNFFYHKNLENHLLQYCQQVVKHPVCIYIYIYIHTHTHNAVCYNEQSL